MSIAIERGDPRAYEERQAFIRDCLRQADEKAVWLSQRPVGLNYDISRFRWIIAVGLSAFVEFIGSDTQYYWLDSDTPRLLTVRELRKILENTRDWANLKHHQMAFRISEQPS